MPFVLTLIVPFAEPDEIASYGGEADYQDKVAYIEKDLNGYYVLSHVITAVPVAIHVG